MKRKRTETKRRSGTRDRILAVTAVMLIILGSVAVAFSFISQDAEIASNDRIYEELAERARAAPESIPTSIQTIQAQKTDVPYSTLPAMFVPSAVSVPVNVLPNEPEPAQDINTAAAEEKPKPQTGKKGLDFESLSAQNPDFAAWLRIPGTEIDYPVVRSDDSGYYLDHMFNGQRSKLGCLFSLTGSDYAKPSRNIAVYGHHLSRSTAMFSTLVKYKKKAYWEKHPLIQLETRSGIRIYRIFAVLNQNVSEWDASTAEFADSSAFMRFVNHAREKAFYDTGVPVAPDDHILTLITCDREYGGAQGRLLVMAVAQ